MNTQCLCPTCPVEVLVPSRPSSQKPKTSVTTPDRGADAIKSEIYGNHRGRNVCSDLSRHASPGSDSDTPTCEDLNVSKVILNDPDGKYEICEHKYT